MAYSTPLACIGIFGFVDQKNLAVFAGAGIRFEAVGHTSSACRNAFKICFGKQFSLNDAAMAKDQHGGFQSSDLHAEILTAKMETSKGLACLGIFARL